MSNLRLKLLIVAIILFAISSSSYWWRDVSPAEWDEILIIWILLPGWGLGNIYRFYAHKSMGVGLWSAGPEEITSQKLLACVCYFMIIIPLFSPSGASI